MDPKKPNNGELKGMVYELTDEEADMICWMINMQERSILRWQTAFIGLMVTFITYIVTEKLIWPLLPIP
jgi:hypothetical protein